MNKPMATTRGRVEIKMIKESFCRYSTKKARVKCFQKVRPTVNKRIVKLPKGIKYADQGLDNNFQNRSQAKLTFI